MRSPVVLAFAVLAVFFAALAPGSSCARKPEPAPSPIVEKGTGLRDVLRDLSRPAANGYVADNAPSLRTATFLASATDAFLAAAITRGRPGTAMGAYGRRSADRSPRRSRTPSSPSCATVGPPLERLAASAGRRRRQGAARWSTTQLRALPRHADPARAAPSTSRTRSCWRPRRDAFLRHAVERAGRRRRWSPGRARSTPEQIDDVVAYVRSMATPPGVPALPPRRQAPAGRAAAHRPDRPQPARARRPTFTSRKISTCRSTR